MLFHMFTLLHEFMFNQCFFFVFFRVIIYLHCLRTHKTSSKFKFLFPAIYFNKRTGWHSFKVSQFQLQTENMMPTFTLLSRAWH